MASIIYKCWDVKYNRPIVGCKVTNPTSGEVEEAGLMVKASPPSIRTIWCNVASQLAIRMGRPLALLLTVRSTKLGGRLRCTFKGHVRDREPSLNTSGFCLPIICNSTTPLEEFPQVIRAMKYALDEDLRFRTAQDDKGVFLFAPQVRDVTRDWF